MWGTRMLVRCLLAFLLASSAGNGQPVSPIQAAVEKRISALLQWAADPIVRTSISRANARPRPMSVIKEIDELWQTTVGIDDFMRSLLTNECAERLKTLRSSLPEISEIFVTDASGANVAMTNKTSDFWQGDEPKFLNGLTPGKRGYHVDLVGFDESIQAYAVQIAVPIQDKGTAIGVMVLTLNLEMLNEER